MASVRDRLTFKGAWLACFQLRALLRDQCAQVRRQPQFQIDARPTEHIADLRDDFDGSLEHYRWIEEVSVA